MRREIDMREISDGRKYLAGDMVRADCRDCKGCSACCRGMGASIVLDPLDMWRLARGCGQSPQKLLDSSLELNVVDGLILPNLKMSSQGDACVFLNDEGRCRVHAHRPGFCRMFPLGRYYEEQSFWYFLQIHECPAQKTKIRVGKWLDVPDVRRYEAFVNDWHYFLRDIGDALDQESGETVRKQMSLYLLHLFYLTPYSEEFYGEFQKRLEACRERFLPADLPMKRAKLTKN